MIRILLGFAFVALSCVDASAFAFRARAPQPTFSSTVYIDPTAGGGGSGSCASPYNTWVGRTLTGNVAFLQKVGTTFTNANTGSTPALSTSGAGTSLYAPLLIGSYTESAGVCTRVNDAAGTGATRGILDVASLSNRGIEVNHSWVTIDSFEVKNTLNGGCIHNSTGGGTTFGMIVKNSYLHACREPDTSIGGASGIWSADTPSFLLNNVIEHVDADGIFAGGANLIITNNTISTVNELSGNSGDGIQIQGAFYSPAAYIAFNTINVSNQDQKHCIIFNSGLGENGFQMIKNTCVAKPSATTGFCYSIGVPNAFMLGNTCQDSWRGLDILAQSTNLVVAGNLFVISGTVANMKCTADNGTTGVKIFNNTCVATTPDTASVIGFSAAASTTITNNIISGFNVAISGSTAESFNNCFNNTTGCAAGSDITTDPLFAGSGTTPYNLQAGSGAKGTGTTPTVKVRTPTGIIMSTPYDMGAYWASQP